MLGQSLFRGVPPALPVRLPLLSPRGSALCLSSCVPPPLAARLSDSERLVTLLSAVRVVKDPGVFEKDPGVI